MTVFVNDIGAATMSLGTYGEWAENEISFLQKFIPKGGTVIDVGAYIGTHTLAFARFVGSKGTVVAIEPQPDTFAVLKKNIIANRAKNIILHNAAAADRVGFINYQPINIARQESFGSASLAQILGPIEHEWAPAKSNHLARAKTPLITIDSLGLQSCALLKIDAEYAEHLVLKGAQRTLSHFAPVVYAECNSIEQGLRMIDVMRSLKYVCRLHVVDAFNPANFCGRRANIFGAARETALVYVPEARARQFEAIRARPQELILEIRTADDLALGMLNKAQYPEEILRAGAAARSGGAAWLDAFRRRNQAISRLRPRTVRRRRIEKVRSTA
jgi:FkbM family methyltransferase